MVGSSRRCRRKLAERRTQARFFVLDYLRRGDGRVVVRLRLGGHRRGCEILRGFFPSERYGYQCLRICSILGSGLGKRPFARGLGAKLRLIRMPPRRAAFRLVERSIRPEADLDRRGGQFHRFLAGHCLGRSIHAFRYLANSRRRQHRLGFDGLADVHFGNLSRPHGAACWWPSISLPLSSASSPRNS